MVLCEVPDLQVAMGVSDAFYGIKGAHKQFQQRGFTGAVFSNLNVKKGMRKPAVYETEPVHPPPDQHSHLSTAQWLKSTISPRNSSAEHQTILSGN